MLATGIAGLVLLAVVEVDSETGPEERDRHRHDPEGGGAKEPVAQRPQHRNRLKHPQLDSDHMTSERDWRARRLPARHRMIHSPSAPRRHPTIPWQA